MAFGYEFVTLTEPEKEQRRHLLDLYATVAQWSALGVFALFQFYFLLSWLAGSDAETERPKSPFQQHAKVKGTSWTRKTQQALRRVFWWAGKSVRNGWGTRGEWIVGMAWTSWLLLLSIYRTGNDYLHLTKRLGMVGVSQLPLHYLLAMRSPYSPVQLLTRLSHEQLKVSHQILGRILCLLFGLHACLYLNFFVQAGIFVKRIKDLDVIMGIMSITIFSILSTTALETLRRWNYRVFYTTHIILASLLIYPLFFHVKHIRPYVMEVFVVILLHQIFRNYSLRRYSGTVSLIRGTNLVQIRIPLILLDKEMKWKVGQHVYLSRPTGVSPSFSSYETFVLRNRTNPFTIASLPAKDKQLLLVARTLNGNTKKLAELGRSLSAHIEAGEPSPSIPMVLEGPYGASARLPDFSTFDRILLVAGGVGATFVLPIYRSIVEYEGASRSPSPQVRFVWAVRKLAETQWAFPPLDQDQPELDSAIIDNLVEVCVTRPLGPDLEAEYDGEDIELAEAEQLIPLEDEMEKPRRGMTIRSGRPDMFAIVNEAFGKSTGRVAVLVCGPQGMTEELRGYVGSWVSQGRDVYWHSETFGW
ncbi:hypothetical protein K432DRAFT_295836 [Lepidopterella palustris CBS 459.81]|uniref:FAD-binding FR-type domain-containing protein n=1 Tax=Lepidopterella palustris CBS 459.81 TaxID=1314670 RepID=A0A8E2ECI2_9PEZI|nr:hypothetical protein K432DRAFT_295836 [Lepidopterella palustris CBS 459.81]